MTRTTNRTRGSVGASAAGLAALLVLSACAPDGDGNGEVGGEGGQVEGGGSVSIYNCEPQNLEPGNSTENCGARVLDQLFTGLTEVDPQTYEAVPAVAENWESDDQITWTFELDEDYTFHNGDPVTAQTFVDTFNWVADPENAQDGAIFYDKILGFEELAEGEADELQGLTAVDDSTLEIELSEPYGQWPETLTYNAFYPMPEVAFEDMDEFQNAPIGNGRYEMDGEWERDVAINMNRFEDWPGESPGEPERIEWSIYSDVDTAYLDVQSGELDVHPEVPPNRIDQVEADFGENSSQNETSRFVYMGLPLYQEEFQDQDIRHALSMAIDRDEIIDQLFGGAYTPARSVLPPLLPEGREDACEHCEFDPDAAAELYEEAGGPSELTIYSDTGIGHDDYVEAIANQWQHNLGVESVQFEMMEFAQYLDLQDQREITGPFRLGWLLAYPSPQYAMEPLYTTGAPSNNAVYENEEFDEAVFEANRADPEVAGELYQQAEDILLEDMPVIPLWFQDYFVVHSDRIEAPEVDFNTYVRAEEIIVTEE